MIPADKAIPLGLLINELVTNAAKQRFDHPTLATMDVALESVCKGKVHGEDHEFRAFVGKSLLRCAKKG
jgi:hypothetical protein